jgi:hypothetical protein
MAMTALGWELPLDAICVNGSFAQLMYFAKSRQRPIAAVHVLLRMLHCGPSLWTFVHLAAFLLAETSVCGLCCHSSRSLHRLLSTWHNVSIQICSDFISGKLAIL